MGILWESTAYSTTALDTCCPKRSYIAISVGNGCRGALVATPTRVCRYSLRLRRRDVSYSELFAAGSQTLVRVSWQGYPRSHLMPVDAISCRRFRLPHVAAMHVSSCATSRIYAGVQSVTSRQASGFGLSIAGSMPVHGLERFSSVQLQPRTNICVTSGLFQQAINYLAGLSTQNGKN